MENKKIIDQLGALAQESRLAIFRLLVEAGPTGLAAGDIGQRLRLPPATLSFHLSQLTHAGLIGYRRNGRFLVYSADFGEMNGLVSFLTENCCGGRPELCDATDSCAGDCTDIPASAEARGR
jgi:ArsR family transcriptional regulator